MKILHILSNFRWTERAEPATDLVCAQRRAGAQAYLVCGRNRGDPKESIAYRAARKGIDPFELELPKHFEWRTARRDLQGLRELAAIHAVDVVHAHMENGWLLSARAHRGAPDRPLLVGSVYDPAGPTGTLRNRYALSPSRTDGILVLCPGAAELTERRFRFPSDRIAVIEPAIDVARFHVRPDPAARKRFGVENAFVVGMVTAVGKRRRIDIVLDAVSRLAREIPELRVLLIGRGKMERFFEEPARRAGIRDRIVLGGYCRDEDLVTAYQAMDVLAYPMHGTDRSCRTVREALTAGVPVVASRIGFLPHLVRHEVTGLLADPNGAAMAEALRRLHRNAEERRRFSEQAREEAVRRFDPDLQAERTLDFYDRLRGGLRPEESILRASAPLPGVP